MQNAVVPYRPEESEEGLTLKEKILFGLFGAIVIGGAIYGGVRLYNKYRYNSEIKNTTKDGNRASYAVRAINALDQWNTDEEMLRQVIREIPSQAIWREVSKSFKNLDKNHRLLEDAMRDALSPTENAEMLAIIAAKPEHYNPGAAPVYNYDSWARRLKSAFDLNYGGLIPGTDEEAIRAVFMEIPTKTAFVRVGAAYAKLYGKNLTDELKEELEVWEYPEFMKIITSKP